MSNQQKDDLVFSITIEELQQEAGRLIGRELDDLELHTAINGIQSGLSAGVEIVFKTAIKEATESEAAA